uniref:Putative secreted protein n=1 Tax=Anopheles triannulatus TaxID=58253 RepID=A0A2M4B3P1_9DIPT
MKVHPNLTFPSVSLYCCCCCCCWCIAHSARCPDSIPIIKCSCNKVHSFRGSCSRKAARCGKTLEIWPQCAPPFVFAADDSCR